MTDDKTVTKYILSFLFAKNPFQKGVEHMAQGDFILKVNNVAMPCPSSFSWQINDVSAGESGRTDDALMHKNTVAKKRKIALQWKELTPAETSRVLTAFGTNEYFDVYYWDAQDGRYETRTFYAGTNRDAPVHYWFANNKRFETVGFDIIER